MEPSSRTSVCCVLVALLWAASFASAQESNGDLYVLSVGVEPKLTAQGKRDLYARDAEFIAEAFSAAKPLYRNVHSRVINGAGATREGVLPELARLGRQVRPQDVAVVFFSTHGSIDATPEYRISLAGSRGRNAAAHDLTGTDLTQALTAIRGRVIVLLDTCCAGGAVPPARAGLKRVAFLVACTSTESSYGQTDRKDRPHGYFVLAVCEALRGLADKDRDGSVTLREVEDYVPARASALCNQQNAVLRRQSECEAIPLAKVEANARLDPLWVAPVVRNPFGVSDVERPLAADVRAFAQQARLPGGANDDNAQPWNRRVLPGQKGSLDGTWQSRWNSAATPGQWTPGTAQVKSVEDRVFILYRDGGKYLIEARRSANDRLVGRYVNLNDASDTSPWVGRIIDAERIDGIWTGGRWDLRRKLADK